MLPTIWTEFDTSWYDACFDNRRISLVILFQVDYIYNLNGYEASERAQTWNGLIN